MTWRLQSFVILGQNVCLSRVFSRNLYQPSSGVTKVSVVFVLFVFVFVCVIVIEKNISVGVLKET